MILHILKVILIILEVLVIFNLMIIVHELGHFLAARWRGLVIEKFGIWFGKPLWKKTINGVEYSLGSIPAGGFVALPQLAPMEVMEGSVQTPRELLPPISVLDKIIVAFAGPLFSFLLAVVFAVVIWQWGRPVSEPESSTTVGYILEKSPAAEAGMQVGDKIDSVDGHPVTRFQGMSTDSIAWSVVRSEGEKVSMVVERDVNGKKETKELWVAPTIPEKTHWWNRKNLRTIGILPSYSFVVGKVQPGSAAEKAGLHIDDVITAINGQKMYVPDDLYEYGKTHLTGPYELTVDRPQVDLTNGARVHWSDDLKMTKLTLPFDPKGVRIAGVEKDSPAEAAGLKKDDVVLSIDDHPTNFREQMIDYVGSRAGVPLTFHILRAGQELPLKITPQVPLGLPPEMEKLGKIGAALESTDGLGYENMGKSKLIHPHPGEQVHQSVMAIVNTVDAVLSRKSSIGVQQMGGPVMMMNAYYHMLSSPEGLRMAIWFSVILNVNLALLNMLPIPVLDGGHITLAIIEAVRRKPMNVRILEYVQTTCAMAIIGFMLFIMFFDVQDLPFVGAKRPVIHFQKVGEEAAK
ncbi:MAG: site-2 protease family protein [Chthoniobacter sp.]|nr:site-2 protease family protein [Chthoniobacter sp.]